MLQNLGWAVIRGVDFLGMLVVALACLIYLIRARNLASVLMLVGSAWEMVLSIAGHGVYILLARNVISIQSHQPVALGLRAVALVGMLVFAIGLILMAMGTQPRRKMAPIPPAPPPPPVP
ncbi:MAG: hypothetical protein JXR77_18450 [Lentisphaeria bacterium]|nr:hypothetical protein [Lentisphaeria bacterium]